MKYLFVKMRRDIASMWVQFFSVFMMSVLAITIYSGMEGVWYGLQSEVENYYEETNIADIWVNGTNITDEMIEQLLKCKGVENLEKSMTLTVGLEAKEDKPDVKLLAMDSLELFNPEIIEGLNYDNSSKDGIWLDESIADKRKIKVGDSIVLKYGEAKKKFVVRGLILDSEFIYYTGSVTDTVPNHELHGYGLISAAAAKEFYGFTICNELRLDVSVDCNLAELQSDVENILGDTYYSFSERNDISSVSQITKEIDQMQNMANLFSAVFILLALLSMYTTMTRLVNTQMVQIGTMKAVGFCNTKIRIHYLLYGLFVSLVGCLLGTVFGQLIVSRAVMKVKKATLTLPLWQVKLSYRTYVIIVVIVLICMLATLLATRRGLNKLPAETMRATAAGSNKDKKRIFNTEKIKLWDRFEYNTKWMIRDIIQNKVRWIMSIIGVAGSMVLMMAGFGFKDSIDYSNDYVYNHQYSYKYKAVFSSRCTEEDFNQIMDLIQGDRQLIYEYSMELYYDNSGNKEVRTLSVIDDGIFVKLETLDSEAVELGKNTVAISKKIADKLGVKEGSTIKSRIIGETEYIEFVITDIVIAPSPQGIFISKDYWENTLRKTFNSSGVLIADESDYKAIKDLEGIREIATIDDQLASMKVMTKSVMTIIYLMIVASVLLGCIIIYNLGMLNYIERYREYATMKVLGFYQKEIREIIIRDCLITTVIGWIIGVPVGYKFLSFYIGIVQFKSFEWVPTLTTGSFILASLAVIMCSVIVNLIVAHKVTRISMVEALKSVE